MYLKPTLLTLAFASSQFLFAQTVSMTNQGELLGNITGWAYEDCAVDMNGDYLDDVVRVTDGAINIDFQQPDGSFVFESFPLLVQNAPNWSIAAADIDENGYTDLLFGNGSRVSFCFANNDGTAYTEDAHPEYIFSQRSTFNDIDNDGDIDAFVNHDVDMCHPYENDGAGNMTLNQNLIQTLDAGGNYAALWVDYDNDGDSDLYITKCRGGAPWGDAQRINLLYRNNGDGSYTSVGPEANMDDGNQSWTTVFEDFDNDGDFDAFTVNHSSSDVPGGAANKLMMNNGDGTFTDVIEGSGIDAGDLGAWNCDAGDFNNDGFVDIFSEMDDALYLNNGDWTFTPQYLPVYSGGIGDFNEDGFLDVVRGSSLYINDGNDNNWIKVACQGIVSNSAGIGARIEIHGSWGVQVREIRSGESFSPMSSLTEHFGLGEATEIDQMVILWPSGTETVIDNPEINTLHIVPEIECISDASELTPGGETSICPGDEVELTAIAGNSYMWSNGAETQSITVGSTGTYSCVIFDENGCASLSDAIQVQVITDETPSITLNGPNLFCEGTYVTMESTIGESYIWSNSATEQEIQITQTGEYFVTIDALCSDDLLQSESISVTVLDAAELPVAEDVIMETPGSVTLTATGENLLWYETQDAETPIEEGPELELNISNSVTYWVEANTIYGGEEEEGGKALEGDGGLPSSGGVLYFNVEEAFTLQEVTIFIPEDNDDVDLSGDRTITLYGADGSVLEQMTDFYEEGEHVVTLNFEVPVGNGLSIGCNQNNLFRNSSGVSYPYPIGTAGEIYDSTFGGSYYYYFYDWKIKKSEIVCPSDRVPVIAGFTNVEEVEVLDGLSVYPNPTAGNVIMELDMNNQAMVSIELIHASGRLVSSQQLGVLNGVTTHQLEFDVAAGLYSLNVLMANKRVQTTLIIE